MTRRAERTPRASIWSGTSSPSVAPYASGASDASADLDAVHWRHPVTGRARFARC